MREKTAWCNRFVVAWLGADPDSDANLVSRLAQRSFAYEGERVSPEVAAREHVDLLRRIKAGTGLPGSR